jgi:translation initiation factor 3 subunit D
MEYYDKAYDRINTKTAAHLNRLKRVTRIYHKVTTMDDPIIRSVRIIIKE